MLVAIPRGARSKPIIDGRKEFSPVEIIKRLPNATIEGEHERRRIIVVNGANVPIDINGNLGPMDNVLVENDPNHPSVRWYAPKVGMAEAGFHFTNNDKFGVGLRLFTGERMKMVLVNDPGHTAVGLRPDSETTLQWNWDSGGLFFARAYVTERQVKMAYRQRSGVPVVFRYTFYGLHPTNGGADYWEVRRDINNQVAFRIPKPWYMRQVDGEWINDTPVPFTKEKVSDSPLQWEMTLPGPAANKVIDPSIIFGEGAGYEGGDHKDTSIIAGGSSDRAYGDQELLYFRDTATTTCTSLVRWSLTNHGIPSADSIMSAEMEFVKARANSTTAHMDVALHRMITQWGESLTEEGVYENPATNGQATHDNAFDRNNPATDTGWAAGVGAGFGSGDYAASAEDTKRILTSDAIGTVYTYSCLDLVKNWFASDANNAGGALICSRVGGQANEVAYFGAQENATVAYRSRLKIEYSLGVGIYQHHYRMMRQ